MVETAMRTLRWIFEMFDAGFFLIFPVIATQVLV